MTITPELAKEFLSKNTKNRPVKPLRVQDYAKMIKAGHWIQEGGGSISFNKDGTLADGQHRLLAVLSANIPVKMLVVFGCDVNPFLDRGAKRTVFDSLRMTGQDMSWATPAMIAALNVMNQEFPRIGCDRDNLKISEYLIQHKESFIWPEEHYKKRTSGLRTAGTVAAFVCAHIAGADTEKLERMAHYLSTGRIYDNGYADPLANSVFALREVLLSSSLQKNRPKGARMQRDIFYCTAYGIKNYLAEVKKAKAEVPLNFPFPIVALSGETIYTPPTR